MGKRKRYGKAFKIEATKAVEDAVRAGGTVNAVAASLGVKENTLSRWVQISRRQEEDEATGGLTTTERSELGELRREVKRLRMEREILKKATVRSNGERNTRVVHDLDGTTRSPWIVGAAEEGTLVEMATRTVA